MKENDMDHYKAYKIEETQTSLHLVEEPEKRRVKNILSKCDLILLILDKLEKRGQGSGKA
jgi:hypothetical protein